MRTANQAQIIGNKSPPNMANVPADLLQATGANLQNTRVDTTSDDSAVRTCASYTGRDGLIRLMNDQQTMSDYQAKCGWLYSADGSTSRGSLGTNIGPIKDDDKTMPGVQWGWDLQQTYNTLMQPVCGQAASCSTLPNGCGWCKTTNTGIPITMNPDGTARAAVTTGLNSCTSANIQLRGKCTQGFTDNQEKEGFVSITSCTSPLSSDCMVQAARTAGCSDKGSLIAALSTTPAAPYTKNLATLPSFLAYTTKVPMDTNLLKTGATTIQTALTTFQQVQKNVQNSDVSLSKAAKDLCYSAGTYDKYNFCLEMTSTTKITSANISCVQNDWKRRGGTQEGTLYPVLAKWQGLPYSNYITSVSQVLANIKSRDKTINTLGILQFTGTDSSAPKTKPEVYGVGPYAYTRAQATTACPAGSVLATSAQLEAAQANDADWCSSGWVADSQSAFYPITTSTMPGCGNGSAGIKQYTPPKAGLNCYGVKPFQGTPNILPFNQSIYNAPYPPKPKIVPLIPNVSTIKISGGGDILHISQIVAKDASGNNVTKGGRTSNSGLYYGPASSALTVDGYEGARPFPYVYHSSGGNAFLTVSLPATRSIASVTIYNRSDGCCLQRLVGYKVTFLDIHGSTIWTSPPLTGALVQNIVIPPNITSPKAPAAAPIPVVAAAAAAAPKAVAAPPPPAPTNVIFYDNYNFTGKATTLLPGQYNFTRLLQTGYVNDSLSSLYVPPGFQVILYMHDIGSQSITVGAGGNKDLRTVGFNKTVSAATVINLSQIKVTGGNNGSVSCNEYCKGAFGTPWNNELPVSWNGGLCTSTGNPGVSCYAVHGKSIQCSCAPSGRGWAAGAPWVPGSDRKNPS